MTSSELEGTLGGVSAFLNGTLWHLEQDFSFAALPQALRDIWCLACAR